VTAHAPAFCWFARRARVVLFFVIGCSMLGVGAFAVSGIANIGESGGLGGGWRSHVDNSLHGILFALAWIALCFSLARSGVAVLNTARRMIASEWPRPTRDSSRVVLYLRSFVDDESGRGTHLLPLLIPALFTHEEQLAAAFEHLGRFEAIGMPAEALPPIGAARRQVDRDTWRVEVAAMMDAARLIIIRAGATPGLQWEIEKVVALNRPRDTMLLVPHSQDAYTAFVAMTRTTFPLPLPKWTAFADTPFNANVAGVVRFTADWHPQALTIRLPSWSLSPLKRGLTILLDHQDDLKTLADHRPRRAMRSPLLWTAAALAIGVGFSARPAAWALSARIQQAVRTVRPFSGPSVSGFVVSLPLPLRDPIRRELGVQGPARAVISRTYPEDWAQMWDDSIKRIDRLSDEQLLQWIELLRRILPKDPQVCAGVIFDLQRDGGVALLSLLAADQPRYLQSDARLLMQMLAAPAGSASSPWTDFADRSAEAQALAEFLQPAIGLREARRYLAAEPGPPWTSNLDQCWFQHVWLDHLPSQEDPRRRTLMRIYFYSYFPTNWRSRPKRRN
jgi:hypothetical protein